MLPRPRSVGFANEPPETDKSVARDRFREKLRAGDLDDKEIEVELAARAPSVEIMAPPGMEELTNQLQGMFQNLGGKRTVARKLAVLLHRLWVTAEVYEPLRSQRSVIAPQSASA